MLRRLPAPLVATVLAPLVGVLLTQLPAAAQAPTTRESTPDAQAQAWIVVDADSGAVLAALNHRVPHLAASLVKVMTAFVTLEQLQIMNDIPVSERAASQQPMRIGMKPGERWKLSDALHALLIVSANDAAYAMAEAAAGTIEDFATLAQRTGRRLGMKDSRWLDPAGFDGDEGVGGGTVTSAYDLAIVARNALEVPELAAIVAKPTYEFVGPDGVSHTLRNHNKLLGTFPGLTGMKTGYTKASGQSLMATAERDGRRLIAVVLGASASHYDVASALLDQSFGTARDSKGIGEILPPTSFARARAPALEEEDATPASTSSGGGVMAVLERLLVMALVGLVIAFFARREQIKRRKRRRLAMRRAYLDSKRRGMIDVIDAERYYGRGARNRHVEVMRPDDDVWPPREMRHPDAERRASEPSSSGR